MKTFSIEKLTLFAIIVIGAFYLFVFPPNSGPDESNHLRAAYQNVNVVMGEVSSDINSLSMRAADERLIEGYPHFPTRETYQEFFDNLFVPLPAGGNEIVDVVRDSGVPHPYIYFPQTAGILVARAFDMNPEWLYLFGRIFNLIFFAVCVWLSIKIAPIGKGVFALVALYPMTMHLAASMNSDVYSIALAFLVLAQYLRIAYSDAPAKIPDLFILLATMALLGPPKVVFIPVMMLAFFLPNRCFHSKTFAWIFRAIVAAVCLATIYIAWYVFINRTAGGVPVVEAGVGELNTFEHIFADPVLFAKTCWRTILMHFEFYYHSLIGSELGWLEISINKILLNVFMALSVLGAFKYKLQEKTLLLRDRIQFPIIFLIMALATAVVMFVSWTPIGSWDIRGLQGRYFLPFWPLFLLFIARWQKPVRPKWLSDRNMVLIASMLHIIVLVTAFLFIYGREIPV